MTIRLAVVHSKLYGRNRGRGGGGGYRTACRMKPAHEQEVHVTYIERWPAHEPREDDPNYKYFNQAKARMKAAGLLKCNVSSDQHYGQIELHHDKVEFAHINDVDVAKFNELYGLHLTDAEFQQWIEGEGNLEPLCVEHHRGTRGVHSLPEPLWRVLRVSKNNHDIVMAEQNTEIAVIKEKKGITNGSSQ